MTHFPDSSRCAAALPERSLMRIYGNDSVHFLNSLVTADIAALPSGKLFPCALLSPQGKILFDFLIARFTHKNAAMRQPQCGKAENVPAAGASDTKETAENAFLLDIAAESAAALFARLNLYKLRADVEIVTPQPCSAAIFTSAETAAAADLSPLPQEDSVPLPPHGTFAALNGSNAFILADSRFGNAAVWRGYYPNGNIGCAEYSPTEPVCHHKMDEEAQRNWEKLRIAFCLPEGGKDFPPGENFPHDVNYDCLGAVSFRKGCYIGQEVVSRMQHKAILRKRLLQVEAAQNLPPQGTEILVAGRPVGKLGTVCGARGLAIVRTDKIPHTGNAEYAPNTAALLTANPPISNPSDSSGEAKTAQAGGIELHFITPPYLQQLLEK